jgi:hypothetical protein
MTMRKKLTHAQAKKLAALRPAGTVGIVYRCDGDEIPVQLKNTLSLADTSAFVDRVALASFTEGGDYIPEYQELMMFGAILQFLSNVPLPELKEPETGRKLLDLAKLHEMMDAMDLLTRIRAMYNSKDEDERRLWKLFDRLECMVLEKLEFSRQRERQSSTVCLKVRSACWINGRVHSTASICTPLPRSFPSSTRSMRKSSWPLCWSALRSPFTPSPQRNG